MRAQRGGYGLQIGGRQIRTELATARSVGFFRRLDGASPNESEMRRAFEDLEVSRFWKPTQTERAVHNLGDGFFVDIGTHEEFKRCVKARASPFLLSNLPSGILD
jgi:hypothetical protein